VSIVVRNAGGSARKAFVDLVAIDSLVSFTHVFVVRHTDCGTTHFTDAGIKDAIRARLTKEHDIGELEAIGFGECAVSPEQRCSEEVAWLREQAFLRKELRAKVTGGVYNLKTGKVELVE
jgi:carbonic anhydrase